MKDFKQFEAHSFDAKKKAIYSKSKFAASRAIEAEFQRSLKKIARASGHIVERHTKGSKLVRPQEMQRLLEDYARLLTPWAEEQSKKLTTATIKRMGSEKAYRESAKQIGKLLSAERFERQIDVLTKEIFLEQVGLIKSIPIEAGERAQRLANEAATNGRRADEVAAELMKTTSVTESRAVLIARTETSRTNSVLNKARATSVGSTHYIWRNMHDGDVRHSHNKYKGKNLDGQVFAWDKPPTLSDGMTGHPGTFPNCRCYAEPILPEE